VPGIVVAVDTRISEQRGKTFRPISDDVQKIWRIGKYAFVAHTGDAEWGEKTILLTMAACDQFKKYEEQFVLRALGNLANHDRVKSPRPSGEIPTIIVYGARSKGYKFRLYTLNSQRQFEPKEENNIVVLGSGAEFVSPFIDKEIDFLMKQLSAAVLTRRKGRVDVGINHVAQFVAMLVDDANKNPDLTTVGGRVVVWTLTTGGLRDDLVIRVRRGENNWETVTLDSYVRSTQQISGKREYIGPSVDINGDVIPGSEIKVWTTTSK
jgi:hypothetical protein